MSTTLSTNEITASAMLMTAIASKTADRKDVIGEVMRRAEQKYGNSKSPDDQRFEVKLLVNGVELDWRAFEKHASNQMEAMVREAAAELVKHMLDHDVQAAMGKLADAGEQLAMAITAEADRLFGRLEKK